MKKIITCCFLLLSFLSPTFSLANTCNENNGSCPTTNLNANKDAEEYQKFKTEFLTYIKNSTNIKNLDAKEIMDESTAIIDRALAYFEDTTAKDHQLHKEFYEAILILKALQTAQATELTEDFLLNLRYLLGYLCSYLPGETVKTFATLAGDGNLRHSKKYWWLFEDKITRQEMSIGRMYYHDIQDEAKVSGKISFIKAMILLQFVDQVYITLKKDPYTNIAHKINGFAAMSLINAIQNNIYLYRETKIVPVTMPPHEPEKIKNSLLNRFRSQNGYLQTAEAAVTAILLGLTTYYIYKKMRPNQPGTNTMPPSDDNFGGDHPNNHPGDNNNKPKFQPNINPNNIFGSDDVPSPPPPPREPTAKETLIKEIKILLAKITTLNRIDNDDSRMLTPEQATERTNNIFEIQQIVTQHITNNNASGINQQINLDTILTTLTDITGWTKKKITNIIINKK